MYWTPDLGDRALCLEELRLSGWVGEYPWEPTLVTVNRRQVWPYALIDVASFERGLGYRKPAGL